MSKNLPDVQDLLLDAIFLVDAEGYIRHANAACEAIFGYKPEELVNRRMIDLVAPDDRERTLEEASRIMAGTQRIGFENRYLHKEGHEVHVMWSARWLEEEGLRVGVARDITALRQAPVAPPGPARPRLSPQEKRVLELLLTDATEKQIAARLGIAESTTHSYVTAVFRKFGVRGRAGLMSLWLQHAPDAPGPRSPRG